LFRSKLVKLYFHGSELEYIEQNQPILLIFFRIFIKGFGRNVEMLFVSEFLRKKIMSALRLDVNSTNTSVCYFGPVYKSKSSKTHFVKSNNKGPLKILTVSRIVRKKGLFEMLDVYEKLSRMIDVEWIIVGGGADEVDFKTDIAQRVNCKINYLGSVDPCSLPDLYENADVFWLCSKYEEGLGLVYLEAAAFDLPSIGLSRGGVVETIWHGKTGLLIDKVEQSLDAIIGLYRLPLSSGNFKSLLVERRNFEFFL
jgi:glycosyltransferase involved in cell wall biosynthesis